VIEPRRILILEDNAIDAELAQFELQDAGIAFTSKVVMTEEDFIQELQTLSPDLILSDYDLPRYNGALALAEARRRCPDTPFILVTGAVSEDRAIEILTQGAKDYVLKNRLQQRLVPAVQRALAEAEEHKERKQAEEGLQAASLYSRTLIEASLDPLVTISSEGKVMDVNKATEEITGVSRGQIIGNDFSDYFTEPEKARASYKKVFLDGTVKDYPLAIRHITGRITDVLYNATTYKNENGEVQGVFAAARDITELKKAEAELRDAHRNLEERVKTRTAELEAEMTARAKTEETLRESEARFRAQYQGNPMPTFTWRMKENTFILEDYNEAAKVFTKGGVVKYINRKAAEMYEDRPEVLESLHRCFAEKGILQREFKSEHFMPGRIVIATLAFVLPDLVIVYAEDITERKHNEEALRKNEELYRNVFENHAAVKLLIDPDTGNIIEANEAAVDYYGWSHEQLKQMKIQEINVLYPEDLRKEMEKARFKKRTHFEFQHRRADGLIRDVEVFSSKIEVKGKDILHSIVHDITDRKQAEEDRTKLIIELKEALSQVKTLGGMLPICASCKKIRDDKGYWNQIEFYIKNHSIVEFSHSICPECTKKLYPDFCEKIQKQKTDCSK